jgi:hypothetical protein
MRDNIHRASLVRWLIPCPRAGHAGVRLPLVTAAPITAWPSSLDVLDPNDGRFLGPQAPQCFELEDISPHER